MSAPVFHAELADPLPPVGSTVVLDGPEGRHAAVVRRIRSGEMVLLTDGAGRAVVGPVVGVGKQSISIEVAEHRVEGRPAVRLVVAQALAKGDRGELAVELLTEVGVTEILPWQASRSIVKWSAERGTKGLARWQSTAREAAKQSRRLWTPVVAEPVTTRQLADRVTQANVALLLHEEASTGLAEVELPEEGEVLLVVGPEGGLTRAELTVLSDAGGRPTLLTQHVLRTSTAGIVACAGLMLRETRSEPVEDRPSTGSGHAP